MVAGIAALMRAKYPTLTPAQAADKLRTTARDAGPRGIDPYYGYGVVDAYAAVGGPAGTDFPQVAAGAGEPNDLPARATTLGASATGTMTSEGDVDWYRFTVDTRKTIDLTVTPPAYSDTRAQNLDPVIAAYDDELRALGEVDSPTPDAAEKMTLTIGAGTYYLSVRNYSATVDTRSYTVTFGTGAPRLFQPPITRHTDGWAESVAVGDVTGDGRNDVVMSTGMHDYELLVYAQQPDGSLAEPVAYPTRMAYGDTAGVALLNADGDGRLDAAVATAAGVEVFHQTAAGTFGLGVLIPGTAGARQLMTSDMDADGDSDLVATTPDPATTSGWRIVLLSQGPAGGFSLGVVAAEAMYIEEIELGDVDSDGRPDVVGYYQATVHVYHRTDTGWRPTDHPTGLTRYVVGIEIVDVTADGRNDIAVSNSGNLPDGQLKVLAQTPTGGLAESQTAPLADLPGPVEAGDADGDGRTDVLVMHSMTLGVLRQRPGGGLDAPDTYTFPHMDYHSGQAVALGDVNGDGRLDVIAANFLYGLVVIYGAGDAQPGPHLWVRDVTPAAAATGVSLTAAQRVTFARALNPASVNAQTVRLLHGRTGAVVPAEVTYDAGTRTATITPNQPLADDMPYRIDVAGVRDTDGVEFADGYASAFRTVNAPPPAVSNLRATAGLGTATLNWTLPSISDLDQVIVRVAAGTTPPASPTAGTAVYAGTGTSATMTGLNTSVRTVAVWVRDRGGVLSPVATLRLSGASVTSVKASATNVTYGGSTVISGVLTGTDPAGPIVGSPVQLYIQKRNTTTWTLVGTVAASGAGGAVSFTHAPLWNATYRWQFNGAGSVVGVTGGTVAVNVLPGITSVLSATTVKLGGSVKLTGKVTPAHPGATVTLQWLDGTSWRNMTTAKLSVTSAYTFTIKPTKKGSISYRVHMATDAEHTAAASPARALAVT